MLKTSRWILRVLNWFNWGVGVPTVLVGLIVGFIYPDQFLAAARSSGTEASEALLTWMRIALPMTAPMIVLVHIVLAKLIAIIDSIGGGTAFSITNANRLRVIAWALLGTLIIDLVVGLYSVWVGEQTGEYMAWGPGLTGWIAVLLLFVLARIFEAGAVMQAELAEVV